MGGRGPPLDQLPMRLPRFARQFALHCRSFLLAPLLGTPPPPPPQRSSAIEQLTLLEAWQHRSNRVGAQPGLSAAGFQVNSQFEEDGLLLYVFALIGFGSRRSVEICAGDAHECNTTNLILNHGFAGLLFDGSDANITRAREFFASQPATRYVKPTCVQAWITAENVASLVADAGFSGEIDLLSIDLDGNDWWIWRALDNIRPRVVITEFNHLWGPDLSLTVPYDPAFKAIFTEYGSDYAGATLAAFVKLGRLKGYRLVGVNRISTNAIFVSDDLVHPLLAEINPRDCFHHPRAKFGMEHRLPFVKNMKWETV
jgi:hypothetical protein